MWHELRQSDQIILARVVRPADQRHRVHAGGGGRVLPEQLDRGEAAWPEPTFLTANPSRTRSPVSGEHLVAVTAGAPAEPARSH